MSTQKYCNSTLVYRRSCINGVILALASTEMGRPVLVCGDVAISACKVFGLEVRESILIPPTFGDKYIDEEYSIALKKMLIIYNDICKNGITRAITAHGNPALILYTKYVL